MLPDKEGTGERGGKFKVGFAQKAKTRGMGVYNRRPDRPLVPPVGEVGEGRSVGQDVLLVDREHLIFGVFDGASGSDGNPREIAHIAAKTIKQSLVASSAMEETLSTDIMSMAFDVAIAKMDKAGNPGQTTATVAWAKEQEDGNYELTIGHAGDSSLYTIDKETGLVEKLTPEQNIKYLGISARLSNWLSAKSESRYITEENQFMIVTVKAGTVLVLCTDGVTGNFKQDRLTDDEISEICRKQNPQNAADALIAASKTTDDKTALVIDLI